MHKYTNMHKGERPHVPHCSSKYWGTPHPSRRCLEPFKGDWEITFYKNKYSFEVIVISMEVLFCLNKILQLYTTFYNSIVCHAHKQIGSTFYGKLQTANIHQ